MTDDEINKRVAEIEGWVEGSKDMPAYLRTWTQTKPVGKKWIHGCPPYATDWAWCGPLFQKYIELLEWDGAMPSRKWMATAKGGHLTIKEDTPQRAICLAVIAAHEPMAVATTGTVWQGLGDK